MQNIYYFYTNISVHAGFLNLGKPSKKGGGGGDYLLSNFQ